MCKPAPLPQANVPMRSGKLAQEKVTCPDTKALRVNLTQALALTQTLALGVTVTVLYPSNPNPCNDNPSNPILYRPYPIPPPT